MTGGKIPMTAAPALVALVEGENAFMVSSFAADARVQVVITGLMNPTGNSQTLPVMFSQGVAPAVQPPITRNVYITYDDQVMAMPLLDEDDEFLPSILSSDMSGEGGVEMNFMLTPVVQVNEDDTSIVITLNDGFELEGTADDITVWQDVELDDDGDPVLDEDDNEIPVQVDYDVEIDADGKNIVITLNDDGVNADPEDEDDIQPVPARINEAVFVRIVGLKNPTGVASRTWSRSSRGTMLRLPTLSSCWAANSVPPLLVLRSGSRSAPGPVARFPRAMTSWSP